MTGQSTVHSADELRQQNAQWRDNYLSGDPVRVKKAEDGIRDFIRKMLREGSFYDDVIPPASTQGLKWDKQMGDPRPSVILDMEPNSPAAISMGFAMSTDDFYLRGDTYRVTMHHLETPEMQVDVDDLVTYDSDVRQIVTDNMVKDMAAEKDTVFIGASDTVVGTLGSTVATSGAVQHRFVGGGWSRESVVEGLKTLPNLPSSFPVNMGVVNMITFMDTAKWGHNEWGGTYAETVARRGLYNQEYKVQDNVLGVTWRITIKKALVPTGEVYYYAQPNCLGRNLYMYEPTLFVERHKQVVRMSTYQRLGGAIANTNGVVRVVH